MRDHKVYFNRKNIHYWLKTPTYSLHHLRLSYVWKPGAWPVPIEPPFSTRGAWLRQGPNPRLRTPWMRQAPRPQPQKSPQQPKPNAGRGARGAHTVDQRGRRRASEGQMGVRLLARVSHRSPCWRPMSLLTLPQAAGFSVRGAQGCPIPDTAGSSRSRPPQQQPHLSPSGRLAAPPAAGQGQPTTRT